MQIEELRALFQKCSVYSMDLEAQLPRMTDLFTRLETIDSQYIKFNENNAHYNFDSDKHPSLYTLCEFEKRICYLLTLDSAASNYDEVKENFEKIGFKLNENEDPAYVVNYLLRPINDTLQPILRFAQELPEEGIYNYDVFSKDNEEFKDDFFHQKKDNSDVTSNQTKSLNPSDVFNQMSDAYKSMKRQASGFFNSK